MDIEATLTELAEEHLKQMSAVPWDSFARHVEERAPRTGGETFGCEVGDRYFDVGDIVTWVAEPGGDILFTSHASTDVGDTVRRVERAVIIPKPRAL